MSFCTCCTNTVEVSCVSYCTECGRLLYPPTVVHDTSRVPHILFDVRRSWLHHEECVALAPACVVSIGQDYMGVSRLCVWFCTLQELIVVLQWHPFNQTLSSCALDKATKLQ